MKLLLPDAIPLHPIVPDGVTTVVFDVTSPIPHEHRDAEAIVLWGSSRDRLATLPDELPHLSWIQGLMAGTDGVHAAGFSPDVTITSGRGLHDLPVAEHTLGLILAAARRFDLAFAAQAEHRWDGGIGGNQANPTTTRFSTLRGAHVLIWGFGGIGPQLAQYLSALGAHVTGVATTAGERLGYRVVTDEDLADELARTDVLVDILPALEGTAHVVDAEILAALPRHAWFVNVGRGATVDEDALVAALADGTIAGAALDVFSHEPLPADSPLWDAPNLIITPHSAGGRPQESEGLIEENLRRYLAGTELLNVTAG